MREEGGRGGERREKDKVRRQEKGRDTGKSCITDNQARTLTCSDWCSPAHLSTAVRDMDNEGELIRRDIVGYRIHGGIGWIVHLRIRLTTRSTK